MSIKEKIAFSTAGVIFLTSCFLLLFFDKFFYKPLILEEDFVGSLSKKQGEVNRRTPEMFQFLPLFPGDAIGNGDSIFTGTASSAQVTLSEESNLYIGVNSLIVIRLKDNQFNIKIERGELSGKIHKDAKIELQTDEESIFLDGLEFQSFALKYSNNDGLKIIDIKTPTKNMSGEESNPNQKKEETDNSKQASQSDNEDPIESTSVLKDTNPPKSSKELISPKKMNGILKKTKAKPKVLNSKYYKTPYPKNDQVILYKKLESLVLLPKQKCTKKCQINVFVGNLKPIKRSFKPEGVPIVPISLGNFFSGSVKWTLKEAGLESKGQFEVHPYSDALFKKALKEKKSIEVAD